MKSTSLVLVLAFILCPSPGLHAEELPPLPEGPLLLTSVTPEQLSPEYWADRLANPDTPLKTSEEIRCP